MIDPEKRCKHLTNEDREMIQNGLNANHGLRTPLARSFSNTVTAK